jgi:hypothetical protein
MVKEIRYTNIRRVLDNLHDHPMLREITLEQVVRYTVRFIEIFGMPKMFQDREEDVDIHEFRGLLPCDLISITQVKDDCSGICLRSMTDTFTPGLVPPPPHPHRPPHPYMPYIPPIAPGHGEAAFKTQGRIIFTSFPEGRVRIAYKAIPVDEDGFPLLIDNENYLACLEAYIKKQVFTVKFDQGKIAAGILQNAQTDYAFLAGQLQSEFQIPSYSEMQSIQNYITSILPSMRHFDNGFRDLGSREYIRNH